MGESKQVKVDNWGIFFLQRLQHFFNKTYFCDLTLQFEDNVQLKVHRLVMNACTEYFQVLEQTCEIINDCLIMPPDLQADVVVPIVNFMYTGILEFQTAIFDRLYSTARLMNMTVLTKLLDAQKVPISPIQKPLNKRSTISPITWNLQGKKIAPKIMDPDLPEPLPGRKLPIWKRKSVPIQSSIGYSASNSTVLSSISDPLSMVDEAPKPTRFEWPDEDDNSFEANSFDKISYTSKPILLPSSREKSPKPSTSSNFEELKRSSVAVKRPASPIYNDNKKVNIQDVKEYIKEQKLRSDYIDYDDSEAADNDLQTYDDDDSADDTEAKNDFFDQNSDDSPNKSILKNDTSSSHNKRVRFSLEGKENNSKSPMKTSTAATIKTNQTVDMTNHTKIITEVLKKYPHLVKKNKNIRLKILAKGSNTKSASGTPVKMSKIPSKVSYMVMKPEQGNGSPEKKDGHWSCHRCSNPNPLQFDTYYLYRQHLTEVHNEKADSQMCNICGHVSRKQNMLMYHKYVKHNITPPPMYNFPKCKECSYVALSPTLLIKHQSSHNLNCAECNTPFPTKAALITHIQTSGHTDKANCPTYDCSYCTKKFISDETLFQHIKNNHRDEAKRDNIINQLDDLLDADEKKENIITAEEIDALEHQDTAEEKPKEKIKIISDIKVNNPIQTNRLLPVKQNSSASAENIEKDNTPADATQPLEPSSEAESLSNVASGIAASLGLVNTIVVLDENQFILQSQDGSQENITTSNQQNFILPDVTNIDNIQNLHVSQHQVLTADNNTIISQATLNKNNITSTDELVMVLTDHDYSDASNNAVITSENSNIVVLYSHPVQSQDGQFLTQPGNLMINPEMGIVEVNSDYAVNNPVQIEEKQCEESIELIQQEINNHLDSEIAQQVALPVPEIEKPVDEQIIQFDVEKPTEQEVVREQEASVDISKEIPIELESEPEKMEIDPIDQLIPEESEFIKDTPAEQQLELQNDVPLNEPVPEVVPSVNNDQVENQFDEPMETEESIELIQQEINKNSPDRILQDEVKSNDIPPDNTRSSDQEDNNEVIRKTENITIVTEVKEPEETTVLEKETEPEISQELPNENISEPMEVDSAKTNENLPLEIESSEIKIKDNIVINDETLPEDTVPDSDEDKSINADEIQLQPTEEINISPKIEKPEPETIKSIETIQETQIELVQNSPEGETQSKDVVDNVIAIIPAENEQISETQDISESEQPSEIINDIPDIQKSAEQEVTPESIESQTDQQILQPTEDLSEPEETTQEIEKPALEEIEKSDETGEENLINDDISSPVENKSDEIRKTTIQNNSEIMTSIANSKISNLLDEWDDGDTDSQQSDTPKPTEITDNRSSINTLINDWEDDEES